MTSIRISVVGGDEEFLLMLTRSQVMDNNISSMCKATASRKYRYWHIFAEECSQKQNFVRFKWGLIINYPNCGMVLCRRIYVLMAIIFFKIGRSTVCHRSVLWNCMAVQWNLRIKTTRQRGQSGLNSEIVLIFKLNITAPKFTTFAHPVIMISGINSSVVFIL